MKYVVLVTVIAALAYVLSTYFIGMHSTAAFKAECEKNSGTYDAKTRVCDLGTEEIEVPAAPLLSAQAQLDAKKDLIVVESPAIGATVSEPLEVRGKARGTWFFEASFPVEVLDAQGVVIGSGIAQAQGDWMTEDFVEFAATVSFTPQPATTSGTLRLAKDNPSGLPENDDAVFIPITF